MKSEEISRKSDVKDKEEKDALIKDIIKLQKKA
jgi:hypothetical protein